MLCCNLNDVFHTFYVGLLLITWKIENATYSSESEKPGLFLFLTQSTHANGQPACVHGMHNMECCHPDSSNGAIAINSCLCLYYPVEPATDGRRTARQKDSDPLQWLCGSGQSSGLWPESRQALDPALSSRQGVLLFLWDHLFVCFCQHGSQCWMSFCTKSLPII